MFEVTYIIGNVDFKKSQDFLQKNPPPIQSTHVVINNPFKVDRSEAKRPTFDVICQLQ